MKAKFFIPTRILSGKGCVVEHAALFRRYGSRALVMTGSASARKNGSLADVDKALSSQGIAYQLFEGVEPNPTIAGCREAAMAAKLFKADFIIGLGGGSALDASKAAAVLAKNELPDSAIFSNDYPGGALPVVAIPTTAGTGSEVTQYAILTNDSIQSKSSISWDGIFPVLAFLDGSYTAFLPQRVAVNTALDALSHAVEGYLSLRADAWSRAVAREALYLFGQALPALAKAEADDDLRDKLLLAANMAGVVIAQTGTTIVHAMGYSLTYFKEIEHGRANGLLLGPYLAYVAGFESALVSEVLKALGCGSLSQFQALVDSLLGDKESLGADEVEKFSDIAMKAKHIQNTIGSLDKEKIKNLYKASLGST